MNSDKPQGRYEPSEIEPKWQAYWETHKTFHVGNPGDDGFDARKPKYYVLDMFPYTSGSGLHVGHPEGYTATDILSRYKRMKGFNVLHPIGWDSFGLPAEQYAVQTNVHPRVTTENAIKNFKRQLKRFGFSYDWDREFATTDLQYYKWTQWIFLKLFNSWFDDTAAKARPIDELIAELQSGKWQLDADLQIVPLSETRPLGSVDAQSWSKLSTTERRAVLDNQRLAFIGEVPVNWCPMLGTVLSNEEVTNEGRSDRGDHPVYRKPLKQWMLRITKYCERLTDDIETVDWPESVKAMQRNWVGRSEGAQVRFKLAKPVDGEDSDIEVFTTRPDTLFGATYMVLAPEHPLVEKLIPPDWPPNTPEIWKNPPSRGLQPTRTPNGDEPSSRGLQPTRTPNGDEPSSRGLQPTRTPNQEGPTTDARIWLLTWTTYGTWLPGDPRGFVGRVPHDKHGHAVHNIPGEPYDAEDARLLSDSVKQMKGEPVYLQAEHAAALDRILNDVAARHALHLMAYSIMKDHVHVVCRADQPSEELLQLFKGNASRELSKQFGKPQERWWTRSGSRRLIKGEPDAACSYVLHQANVLASGPTWEGDGARDSTSAGAEAPGSGGAPHRAVMSYVEQARNKSDLDRTADTKEKTGVFTGAYAVNPVNNEEIPIWVADYVLMGYGTGAIMAVPGQDERDWEFAEVFDLPIIRTVQPPDDFAGKAFSGEGPAINSQWLNGLHIADAMAKTTSWLEERGLGRGAVNYKLRDWLFSRQRYWGEPFPILHGPDGEIVALDESELPLDLPHMDNFKPDSGDDPNAPPRPPLGRAKEWTRVDAYLTPQGKAVTLKNDQRAAGGMESRPVGSPRGRETGENVARIHASAGAEAPGSEETSSHVRHYTRELNTMPQWAGSCWYYLRYISATSDNEPWNGVAEKYWMNVDQYVGGAEHAVLHLLYARFWHKVLYDLGYVSTVEPFQRLFNQGLIQSFAYKDKRGMTLATDLVEEREEGQFYHKETGEQVEQIVAKMSKALKNVVNPDIILDEFGADTFRLYEMYMGPLDAAKPWNTRDIPGLSRFLARVWRLIIDEQTGELSAAVQDVEGDPGAPGLRQLHKMIQKVGQDIEEFKLNTAIAEMIALTNALTSAKVRSKKLLEQFVLVLSPFAPHICEELWQRLGHGETLAYEPWPTYDPELARDTEIEVPVQINGKVRARIMLPADADQQTMEAAALADETIKKLLEGKTVRKVIVVPGKLVNIVAG